MTAMDLHRSRISNRVLLAGPLLGFLTMTLDHLSQTFNLAPLLERPLGYLTSVLRLHSNQASSHGHSRELPLACLVLALDPSRSSSRISLVLLLGLRLAYLIRAVDNSSKRTISLLGLEQFHLKITLDLACNSRLLRGTISGLQCNSRTPLSDLVTVIVPRTTRTQRYPPSSNLPGRRLLLR